jgi:hypothetical protein
MIDDAPGSAAARNVFFGNERRAHTLSVTNTMRSIPTEAGNFLDTVLRVDVLLEARSRAELEKPARLVAPFADVVRDRHVVSVPLEEAVPGDLLVWDGCFISEETGTFAGGASRCSHLWVSITQLAGTFWGQSGRNRRSRNRNASVYLGISPR